MTPIQVPTQWGPPASPAAAGYATASGGGHSPSPPRPPQMKRVRTEERALANLDISDTTTTQQQPRTHLLPPPPDCPPYLQASQLPVWVGRAPAAPEALTPERVDELHHVQWCAWKEGRDGRKNYGRILEAAPALFHAAFCRLNPHNYAITVGITVDAMHATGAPPLACATTFLYGLSLLADNPSKQTIPIQFCRAAPHFMGDWARHAFAGEEEGRAIESLLEFCGVFPFSGLPDALGKRVEAHVERLMGEGREQQALALIRRCLEAPWAEHQKIWDEDLYWKLRLLSYICKRRTLLQAKRLPPPPHPPVTVKVACLVFRRSSGRLPPSLEEAESGGGLVECAMHLSEEQVQASLSAMQQSFALFSESFLALTKGTVKWELVFKPQYDFGDDPAAIMPARPYHREVEAPTNPNRLVSQADVEHCPYLTDFLQRRAEEEGDEDLRDAQALLVIWPGLRPMGSYMLTCGGITPRSDRHTLGGRAVFMSDGAMLSGRPVWSPMWFHHETFHILEHLFPEAPFSEASQVCGHPCFMREQWPALYEGFYEWDYYYHSYKTAVLHPSVQPSLAARIARKPSQPHTYTLDASRRDAAPILARLAQAGDTVLLRINNASSQHQGAALGFRPGALPAGVTLRPEGGGEWSLAAFWVHAPPCYVVTMARAEGGQRAHELLLDALLSATDGSAGGGGGGGSSNSGSSSPCMTSGGSASSPHRSKSRASPLLLALQQRPPPPAASTATTAAVPIPKEALLKEGAWPVAALATDGFVGYAQQAVERCVAEGRCTFAATGASWMPQAYYVCRTCRELNAINQGANVGCCLPCAAKCHRGHDLEARPATRFYCDCGLGNFVNLACQCLTAEPEGFPLHNPTDDDHEQQQQQQQQQQGLPLPLPEPEQAFFPPQEEEASNSSHSNSSSRNYAALPPLILVSASPPAHGHYVQHAHWAHLHHNH